MPDVVEQGPLEEEERGRTSPFMRVVLLVVVALVALAVSRSGLLSAEGPPRATDEAAANAADIEDAESLVAESEGRLVRLGDDDGPSLPAGELSSVIPVRSVGTRGDLVGVVDGTRLFRIGTGEDARWAPIGRATAVLAASRISNRAVILRGDRVVEVDVTTGRLVDAKPFVGFDAAQGWSPEGLVSVTGTRALLMSRPGGDGDREELAIAWPSHRVNAQFNPPVQSLGVFGRLLGIADDWVVVSEGRCPGADCQVKIVTLTRDDRLVREVFPPDGWSFRGGKLPGRLHEALLPVQRLGDADKVALARRVAGGNSALLVDGTRGVDVSAGLVESAAAAVYLVTRTGDDEVVRVWRPGRPGRAQTVLGGDDALPRSARLLCVCG